MCNHYEKNAQVIRWAAEQFGEVAVPSDLAAFPDHTWPKSPAPVLLETEAGRSIAVMRWGVHVEIQGATKPLTKFVTNARNDKLAKYPWRFSVRERRCLIPAIAYYEPDGPPGGKWEVRYSLREHPMFFFAGLWDTDPDRTTQAFTMVTTSPNELAAQIHDRMPLVLDAAGAREWLGRAPLSEERLLSLCMPYPASAMASAALAPPQKKIAKPDLQRADGELRLE